MSRKCNKNTSSANLSKYSIHKQLHSVKKALTFTPKLEHSDQQSINGHTCALAASN